MPKFQRFSLISMICLMSLVLFGLVGFSQSPQPSVRLTTDPPLNQILPFQAAGKNNQPVELTLEAVDASGQRLKNAQLHLQMQTPDRTPWFSTDFPLVEGTRLLDLEAKAPEGALQLQQLFPIRGKYQLQVEVAPTITNAFQPFEQTLTIPVQEHGVKYRNLGILAVILIAVGFGGGWLIGGRPAIQPGEIAPQRVRLLLSGLILIAIAALLFVNISAELVQSEAAHSHSHSHDHDHSHEIPGNQSGQRQSQGLDLRLSGDQSTTVGQLANLEVTVVDSNTQKPVTDVLLKLTTTQLEDQQLTFAYQAIPDATGKFSWQQQFFDGAPHAIAVEVTPQPNATRQFSPFQVTQTIEVAGVAPPLSTRLLSLFYFTGMVVLGLFLGLGWQKQRSRRLEKLPSH